MSEERLNELFSIINDGYPSIQEQEIDKLNYIIDKQDRDITTLTKEKIKLKNIINELEKDLKSKIEWNENILKEDNGKPDLLGFNFHREAYIKIWKEILDKLKELKKEE